MREHPSSVARFLFWIGFVAVLATPSTIATYDIWTDGPNAVALVLGGLLWAGLLTLASGMGYAKQRWCDLRYRTTFWVFFCIRLALAVVYPVGIVADLIPGGISGVIAVTLTQAVLPTGNPLGELLFAVQLPVYQGGLLVGLFFVVVNFFHWALTPPGETGPRFEGLCLKCGYDLRASEGSCPECGEPIPETRD